MFPSSIFRCSVVLACLLCAGIYVTLANDAKKDIRTSGRSLAQERASKPPMKVESASPQGQQLSHRSFPGQDSGLFPLILLIGTIGLLIIILWVYDRLKNGVAQDV